jgi:hypothetical protein
LTSIDVAANNANYASDNGILFNKTKTTLLQYPAGKAKTSYTLPNSVTSSGDYAFDGCRGLASVTIPEGVTNIEYHAFNGCSGLTAVTIPESVTSIKDAAFHGCSGLISVTIPERVTSIGNNVFNNCCGLTNINVDAVNANYASDNGVLFNKIKTTLLKYPASKVGTSYIIPNSVTSIGNSAFEGCSGLRSVTISERVTNIGDYAFNGCSGLSVVTIPEEVTNIGNHAFNGCSGLTAVTIPEGVTNIGNSAFNGCSGLTAVTIPKEVKSIGTWAFYGCSALTSVNIPKGVRKIGNGAFKNCRGLTSITNLHSTPQCINEVDDFFDLNDVFYDFFGLWEKNDVFDDVERKTCILYVPQASLAKYQAADGWKKFSNIQAIGGKTAKVVKR